MASFVPSSDKRYAQFRGPTNSNDYNDLVLDSYADILRLYNLLKDLDETMRNYFAQYIKENVMLRQKTQQLEQDLEDITPNPATPETNFIYARFYDDSNLQNDTLGDVTIPEGQRLTVDTSHGIITLPLSGTEHNFVSLDEMGATLVPPGFSTTMVQSYPAGSTVSDGNFYYALSENSRMVWEQLGLLAAPPATAAELDIWIRVPIEITSNINANCLILHLFPIYFIDLLDVSYSIDDAPTNNLNTVVYYNWDENWNPETEPRATKWIPPVESNTYSHINNCKPLRFDFDPLPITAIHLKLRQRNYMKENDLYVVPFGMSYITLDNNRYSEFGSKVIKFTAPEGELIYSVTELEYLIYNQPYENYGDIAGYRLFYEHGGTGVYTEVALNQYIPGGTEDIYLEITLYETPGHGTPALSGVKLYYENS